MTDVKISGTFAKDDLPDNGLRDIAGRLARDEHGRVLVVGLMRLQKTTKEPDAVPVPTMKYIAVEPVEDSDIDAVLIRAALDRLRQRRGLRPLSDRLAGTLFDPHVYDDDEPSDEEPKQEDPPLEHEGATEEWGDELEEMKRDLGVNPTVCAQCGVEIHYDGAAGIFLDDSGFPAGDGHQHEPQDR